MALEDIAKVDSEELERAEEFIDEVNSLKQEYDEIIPVNDITDLRWTGNYRCKLTNQKQISIPSPIREAYGMDDGDKVEVMLRRVGDSEFIFDEENDYPTPEIHFRGDVVGNGSVTVPKGVRTTSSIEPGDELIASARKCSLNVESVIYGGDKVDVVENVVYEIPEGEDISTVDTDDPDTNGYTVRNKKGEVLFEHEDEETAMAFAEGMEM